LSSKLFILVIIGALVVKCFRLLTDFVCLYNYEFWLSLCKIVRSSVILLLPLFLMNYYSHKIWAFDSQINDFFVNVKNIFTSHIDNKIFLTFFLTSLSLYIFTIWKCIAYNRFCRDGIYFNKILVSEYKLFKRSKKANLFIALVQ
jgi:hypothetical protein